MEQLDLGQPPVYLVDGSAYIYRAYHAIRPLTTSEGLPTQAIYGFTTILKRILRHNGHQYVGVALDSRGPVFRHRLYPAYKANRPPMPDDLAVQIPYIHQIIKAYNIPSFISEDLEADDLIASAVRRLTAKGYPVVIVSGDKDLLQLVSDNVVLWDPMNDKRYDVTAVREKYGLGPEHLLDYFALVGDKSDNIPGVVGIGPKTARKLIAQYGNLEGIYQHLDEIKGKLHQRLLDHREDAFLSRELIRLRSDAELPDDPAGYLQGEPDYQALRDLLTRLEFFSLLKDDAPAEKVDTSHFHLVKTEAQLTDLFVRLAHSRQLVLDTETTSLDPLTADLVGISLCDPEDASLTSWYLPCGHRDQANRLRPNQIPRERLIQGLQPLLTSDQVLKIGHNLKYDWSILQRPANGGLVMRGPFFDTMVGAWLLDPGRRTYKLDNLCEELDLHMTSFAEVTGGDRSADAFARVAPEAARDYSCEDVYGACRLYQAQKPRLKELGLWKLYAEVEGPLIPVLARMELTGILVDTKLLKKLSTEFGQRLASLAEEIYEAAGRRFNINSPQQLGAILFEELGLPRGRKTKTGYSTNVRELERLKKHHPLPGLILRYRNLAKLKSTYIDKLNRMVHPQTGRVHTSFNQCGTATGRLSSSDPNLQNIPIRTEEGRRIRSAFVAAPGCRLLSGDYSQIDLRVLAHYSQDPALLTAFRQGQDIHRRTAAEIFQVEQDQVTPAMRRVAKTINFGIIYGMSSFGLARQLEVSRQEAQGFIDRYFAVYAGVRAFMEAIVEKARQEGYVTTLLGRRRLLPEIRSRQRTRREFAERTAINTPIQGTAADIIKLAMIEVDHSLQEQGLAARMVLQIHDELVLEVEEADLEPAASLLQTRMETVLRLDVDLKVNLRVSRSLDK